MRPGCLLTFLSAGHGTIEGLTAVLSQQDAAKYNYDNLILAHDEWNPRAFFENQGEVVDFKLSAGRLIWQAVPGAIGYAVYDGNQVLAFTQEPALMLTDGSSRNKEELKVYAINPSGSISGMFPPLFTSK